MAKMMVCIQCGSVVKPKTAVKGSFIVEVGLWCLLLVPGIIYSLWRSSSRHKVCPICRSTNLVPESSPIAKKILEKQ